MMEAIKRGLKRIRVGQELRKLAEKIVRHFSDLKINFEIASHPDFGSRPGSLYIACADFALRDFQSFAAMYCSSLWIDSTHNHFRNDGRRLRDSRSMWGNGLCISKANWTDYGLNTFRLIKFFVDIKSTDMIRRSRARDTSTGGIVERLSCLWLKDWDNLVFISNPGCISRIQWVFRNFFKTNPSLGDWRRHSAGPPPAR